MTAESKPCATCGGSGIIYEGCDGVPEVPCDRCAPAESMTDQWDESVRKLIGRHLGPHLGISPTPRYEAVINGFVRELTALAAAPAAPASGGEIITGQAADIVRAGFLGLDAIRAFGKETAAVRSELAAAVAEDILALVPSPSPQVVEALREKLHALVDGATNIDEPGYSGWMKVDSELIDEAIAALSTLQGGDR
jgi:hypothetical protein